MLGMLLWACSKRPSAIAELTKADGPVERQAASAAAGAGAGGSGSGADRAAWGAAAVGTRYFLGDAARTTDSTATLDLGGSGAQIAMQDHTVLRFGGTPGEPTISVEAGAIDLAGTGSYSLDVGAVTLSRNARVRITSRGSGRSSVELTIGQAQVAANGRTFDLAVGRSVDVDREARVPVDAGVRDARAVPADAATGVVEDAAADAGAGAIGDATIEVTGKRAELRAPGEAAWKPLPAGAGTLARGSAVRVGPGTTAKLVAGGATLELGSGARAQLGADLTLSVEQGLARAAAVAPATIALPGGAVALGGAPGAPAEAKLDSTGRDTRITMLRGASKLTGSGDASLVMNRGETASLARTGAIRVVEAIPSYFDLRVAAGESLTIHDPRPPAAVQLQFDGKCPDGGIIEVDRDARFRTAKQSSGHDFANVMIGGGSWAYRLRCTANGAEGNAVASGRVTVIRDDGRRPLPKNQGVNDIDADGRNYRISYQSAIPNVAVHITNAGARHKLHLATAGKEQTFDSSTSSVLVPGAKLHEGTYTYWVDRDGVKQDKVSTLTIDFDQTAPQVYIESPINGQAWSDDLDVRGAVLPGWSAAVEAIAIPIDPQRRFAAKVGIPGGAALAIRLSHPQRGVHFYLRRPK
jgi:hypothetical protein